MPALPFFEGLQMPRLLKQWVYKPDTQPVVIDSKFLDDFKAGGWHDSPLAFATMDSFGVDKDDHVGVQIMGESIEGVKNYANDVLNIERMNKKELLAFCKRNSVVIDEFKTIWQLRKSVKYTLGVE